MPLEPGAKLGSFEILSSLSKDDFGEVYKASDTARNRVVTLRLLPASSARLERETHLATSLNHPHIASVYEVGVHDGTAYVAAEFVAGETLAERLRRGPLELQEGLRVAIEVADALDKAHRKGLVHRNLTPSSILLSPDGVKLADFGIAAASSPTPAEGGAVSTSMAPTRSTSPTLVAPPTLAMPYQSPEQIEGREPDVRSDIFAFGAILYEIVAGRPPFEGKTQALLTAAIASVDPEPLSKVQPLTPPALDFIVRRCLAKTPQKRLQSAWDVLCQLRWIAEGGQDSGASWSAPQGKRERILRLALMAAALLALALAPAAYFYYRSAPASVEARFVLNDLGFMRPPGGSTVYISPNGRWVITSRATDEPGLDALEMNSVTKQSLLDGIAIYIPFWKPDSENFGFWEGGKMKRAAVSGGPAANIVDAPAPFGGASWSTRGVIVYSSGGALYRVLDVGGESTPIAKPDPAQQETEYVAPHFLPDGNHFLYLAASSQPSNSAVYVGSLDSTERARLFASVSRVVYATPGYLLFNRGDVLYAHAFDAQTLKLSGEPVRIADGIPPLGFTNTTPLAQSLRESGAYAVSNTGILSYRLGTPGGRGNAAAAAGSGQSKSLVWFGGARNGNTVGPDGTYAGLNLAPDGKRFAVHRHEGDGGDIWVYDGERMQRWTTNVSQENSMPVWSPDGKRIAFASRREGKWGLYVKAVDNTGAEEKIVEPGLPLAPMSWVQDQIVYWVDDPKTRGDIWAVSMSGEHKPMPILATNANELFPQVSPDGKWIAYQALDAMNIAQIWVNSFPKGQASAWQITNDGGGWPRWRSDGKELTLYFVFDGMQAVTLRVAGDAIQAGVPRLLFGFDNPNLLNSSHYVAGASYHRYAVSPDGQNFLIAQPPTGGAAGRGSAPGRGRGFLADAVLAAAGQGGGQGANPPNEIAVILNWPRLIKPE